MRPPSPTRLRTLPLLGGAALAALLLTACSSASQLSVPWLRLSLRLPGATPTAQPSQPAANPSPTETPAAGIATAPLTIEQFVPVAERFVEAQRGHAFKSPVPVTLLGDADFRKRLLSDQGTGGSALSIASRELKAVHLINPGVDLGAATNDLLGAGVSGFYDPKSKSLVVRGVAATPYVRQVLVHELTHALQDQYFGIDRPQLDKAYDEQAAAFQAVVEGDAVRIENDYHQSMSAADQAEADFEERQQGGTIPSSVPQVLLATISFPYVAGPRFIDELYTVGGNDEVDKAFVHPPVSTAQILNSGEYLDFQAPRTVAVPHADGTPFDHGVNGEFGLILLLEAAGMSVSQAETAASIWGGDEYVAWNRGSGACVRMAWVADTPSDQGALDSSLSTYAHWAGADFTASTGGTTPSVVTSCY